MFTKKIFNIKMPNLFLLILTILSVSLSGCKGTVEKLKSVSRGPSFANLEIPTIEEDEEEVERHKSRLEAQAIHARKTNSLWQPGSTKFFRDSRAWRVGDIIRVVVEIKDNASLNNSTQQNRSGADKLAIPSLFGKEKAVAQILSPNADPGGLIQTSTTRAHTGSGNISRKEDIRTEIAAIVSKVLPNGNLVIQGHQEVRVNYELREVKIAGIIRPKDITSDNSVRSNQMAEARISYGGRGGISDMQQPRVGSQIIDILSPF
jgi:flagellar L-ring protein precursor FlgH